MCVLPVFFVVVCVLLCFVCVALRFSSLFCHLYFWIKYCLIVQKILQVFFSFLFFHFHQRKFVVCFCVRFCLFIPFFAVQDDNSRIVKQFHFCTWSDHGAPTYPTTLLAFRRKVQSFNPESTAPILCHCRSVLHSVASGRSIICCFRLVCTLSCQIGLYSVGSGWSVLFYIRLVCTLLHQVSLYSVTSG